MHFTKPLTLLSALLTLGLASPTPQDHDDTMLSSRDTQAANIMLIQDTIAKTGYDIHGAQNLTEQQLASLSGDDAQILAGELNKWSVNHDRKDLLIPAFGNKDFEDAAAGVRKEGALVEARGVQLLHFFLTLFHTALVLLAML
ncbi:hypothetical protein PRZ48_006966 [Zasmidium cellare]|uniref:Uncharacterized protein n=1 Tax=Zasmidium cellare TaxID=395010 RepID=A0ABR0EIU5_ZASCE|nr:hypothetical protein PRZ48_006966 [Zasmidium cellare]